MSTYNWLLITVVREKPFILLDEVLHYLALVWHVIDHVSHVVLRSSHQRRTKDYCQVTRLHLNRSD